MNASKHAEMNTSGETCIDSVPLPMKPSIPERIRRDTITPPGQWTVDETRAIRAYGDERVRVIAEDRNCWKSVAEGEAELRAIANDELEEAEARIAELETLLKMIATRAANFPDFPMGWRMPEVFKAVGMQMPERPP